MTSWASALAIDIQLNATNIEINNYEMNMIHTAYNDIE